MRCPVVSIALRHLRTLPLTASVASVLLLAGCTQQELPQEVVSLENAPPAAVVSEDDQLRDRVDRVLDFTEARHLDVNTQAAWQVVHGVLAFGPNLKLQVDGELVPALDYLLAGGKLDGWNFRPGEKGLIAVHQPGTARGQGHLDQWIGYMCQSGLQLDDQLVVDGQTYTVADLVEQAKWDIRDGMEASWTLMGLSTFLPLDAQWTASDGEVWTIDRILAMELERNLSESACGGSHRLVGITMAVNQYLADGRPLTGVWQEGDDKIQWAVQRAQQFQQPDGSMSTNYFERPASSPDVALQLSSTGHIFEFLMYALPDGRLNEPWVTRAATRLCDLLEMTQHESVECGKLYHAAHGLLLYRLRRFGPRDIAPIAEPATTEQDAEATGPAVESTASTS